MNDKQKAFLDELYLLLKKYNINKISSQSNQHEFYSGDNILSFSVYADGCFIDVETYQKDYNKEVN